MNEPRLVSPSLRALIGSVRVVIGSESDCGTIAGLVARRLELSLRDPNLLTADQYEAGPDGYKQHILHVENDGRFSIVTLVWLPGQSTAVHDHVSWCATGVYHGEETETLYRLEPSPNGSLDTGLLIPTEQRVNAAGTAVAVVPPGDIHRVANDGDDKAVSIHIYGADIRLLGSSIRRRYELHVSGEPTWFERAHVGALRQLGPPA